MSSALSAAPDEGPPLRERVILVTGATGGIGAAVARACARAGATVVLHGRDPNRLDALYDGIPSETGIEPAALPLDLGTATSAQFAALAADIGQALGRLDGIVHCAFRTPSLTPVDGVSAEEWNLALRINVVAPLSITRACLPLLRQAPDAPVIYTLESHFTSEDAYLGALAVPGAALSAAVRIQAEEWSGAPGLRCHAIIPGPVDSPSRSRTHPGESPASRPPVDRLIPAYLDLLGPAGKPLHGKVLRPLG